MIFFDDLFCKLNNFDNLPCKFKFLICKIFFDNMICKYSLLVILFVKMNEQWQLPNLMTQFTQNVDGERVAVLQSIEQYYNRRISREKDEILNLKALIDQQFLVIERLNIHDTDLRHKTKKEPEKTQSDEYKYYKTEETNEYIKYLQEANDFSDFFSHHPFMSAVILDPNFSLDMNNCGEAIQQFLTDKRNNFYKYLFEEINYMSKYFIYFNIFLNMSNFLEFSEKISSELVDIFNFKRVIVFDYDKELSQISVNKQRLVLNYSLEKGLIKNSIETGKRYFIQKLSKNAGSDDFAILGRSDNMWVVPIPELANIIILYDTEELVTASKDLLMSRLIEIIKKSHSIVEIREEHLATLSDYQLASDELIKLASIGDMRNFLQLLTKNLESSFECEAVRLIRIRRNRLSLTKYGHSSESNTVAPLQTGLASLAYLHKKTQTFEDPELLAEFDRRTDRAERSIKSTSIMAVPVFACNENERVKWILVFYNKKRKNGFSENDITRAEIFAISFASLAKNVLLTAKMNENLRDTTTEVNESRKRADFASHVKNCSDIQEVTDLLISKVSQLLPYDSAATHIADFSHGRLDGTGSEGRVSRPINSRDSNPTMRFMLTRNLAICPSNPQVFAPLISSKGRTLGILVLKSSKVPKQERVVGTSFLRTPYMMRQTAKAKVVKELSGLAQIQLAQFTTMVPRRTRAVIESYSQMLSRYLELDKELRKNFMKIDSVLRFSQGYSDFPPEFNRKFIACLPSINKQNSLFDNDILTIDEGNLLARIFSAGFKSCNLLSMSVSDRQSNYTKPTATILYLTHAFDYRVLDDTQLVNVLIDIANDFEVLDFFEVERQVFVDFIQKVRSFTNNNGFRSWRLAFDHVHFCFYLLHAFNAVQKVTAVEKSALYVYLLCLYSEPFPDCDFSCPTSVKVFSLLSVISKLNTRKLMSFMDLLTKLDDSSKTEALGSASPTVLMAALSKYSYIGRDTERAQKSIEMRFAEEFKDEPKEILSDLIKATIDFETKIVVFPALADLLRFGFETDATKKILTEILNIITK